MSIPNWYSLILLVLAAARTWKLIAEDDILDRPRRYITRLGPTWKQEGDSLPSDYRIKLAAFIACPWCLGFWVGVGWWGAWQISPHGTLIAASLAAASWLIPVVDRLTSD